MSTENAMNSLTNFPCLEIVFSFLSYKDLLACPCTCTSWRRVVHDTSSTWLWKSSCLSLLSSHHRSKGCAEIFKDFSRCTEILNDLNWRRKFFELHSVVVEGAEAVIVDNSVDPSRFGDRILCRSGHSGSVFFLGQRECLVLFGGATNDFQFVNTFEIIVLGDERSQLTRHSVTGYIPAPRWLHACSMMADRSAAVVFGGQGEGVTAKGDLFTFALSDIGSSIQCALVHLTGSVVPAARAGHSLLHYEGDSSVSRFILFGGRLGHESGIGRGPEVDRSPFPNEVYELELWVNSAGKSTTKSGNVSSTNLSYSGVWKKLPCIGTAPCGRWCHSAVLSGREMIVFGGWAEQAHGANVFFNDMYSLNLDTLEWREVNTQGPRPWKRCQAACFVVEGLQQVEPSFEAIGVLTAPESADAEVSKLGGQSDGNFQDDARDEDHDEGQDDGECVDGTLALVDQTFLLKDSATNDGDREDAQTRNTVGDDAETAGAQASDEKDELGSSAGVISFAASKGYLVVFGGACHHEEVRLLQFIRASCLLNILFVLFIQRRLLSATFIITFTAALSTIWMT